MTLVETLFAQGFLFFFFFSSSSQIELEDWTFSSSNKLHFDYTTIREIRGGDEGCGTELRNKPINTSKSTNERTEQKALGFLFFSLSRLSCVSALSTRHDRSRSNEGDAFKSRMMFCRFSRHFRFSSRRNEHITSILFAQFSSIGFSMSRFVIEFFNLTHWKIFSLGNSILSHEPSGPKMKSSIPVKQKKIKRNFDRHFLRFFRVQSQKN